MALRGRAHGTRLRRVLRHQHPADDRAPSLPPGVAPRHPARDLVVRDGRLVHHLPLRGSFSRQAGEGVASYGRGVAIAIGVITCEVMLILPSSATSSTRSPPPLIFPVAWMRVLPL